MKSLINTWNKLEAINQIIQESEIAIDNINRWPNKTREDYQELSVTEGKLANAKEEKLSILNQIIEDAEAEKVAVCETIPDEK